MNLGNIEAKTISAGPFRLDGGGMFGVLPKPVWSRLCPPDEKGRVPLETHCLLLRTEGELILVDTGCGPKMSAKEQEQLGLSPGNPLLENLAAAGIAPEDITTVLFTHLHMDHCGGATHWQDGHSVPSFPNARYLAQRQEWEDALANRSHMRVSYRPENLFPLQESGRLQLLDGDCEVAPGVSVRIMPGHTPAHQMVLAQGGGATLAYPADVVPTVHHLRPYWGMAYDLEPYRALLTKQAFLAEAARQNWWLLLDHDPHHHFFQITEQNGTYEVAP